MLVAVAPIIELPLSGLLIVVACATASVLGEVTPATEGTDCSAALSDDEA